MSIIKRNNSYWGLSPMFSDFFGADDFNFDKSLRSDFLPAVNVAEDDKKYEIELAAPGLSKEDFKINVEKGMLTISAERKEEKEELQKNYTRQEYSYQSFSRSFALPDNAMEDDIKARYENGVLKLDVAKKLVTVSKTKEIEVT
ncbi:MAG: Hsp20/alpha crystallin family protein [Bacteroidetes bacterium]|nr:Hsp20/alpha crystallin family protein [Bacteroidota bacterium]